METYQNKIARFKPRVNEAVNSHWLCDEGRYCFHDLAGGERLTTPLIRQEGGLVAGDLGDGVASRGTMVCAVAQPLAGILSGRNTNEEAYLFAKLMRKLPRRCCAGGFLSGTRTDRSTKDSDEPGSFAEFPRRARYGSELQRWF